jgi:hypothetical protein
VPRISALLMLRSTISTVSAPAAYPFRGSITNPTQLLCTLRGRRYRQDLVDTISSSRVQSYRNPPARGRFVGFSEAITCKQAVTETLKLYFLWL